MGRTIAIGDIHGCSKALRALLDAVRPERDDTLVLLGDYVDRGPDSRGVLEELMQLRQLCHMVPLRGNHELMMLAARILPGPPEPWLSCGGHATLKSYGGRLGQIPDSHVDFLCSLRSHYETASAIFVHAGYIHDRDMHDQSSQSLYWDHLPATPPHPHHSGKTVFVGHTPQWSGQPLDLGHLVCIDTYCFGGRWLTAVDVDSRETWQADDRGQLRRDSLSTLVAGCRSSIRRWTTR